VSVMSIMIISMLAMLIWAFRGVDWELVIDSIVNNTAYASSQSEPVIIINQPQTSNGRDESAPVATPETAVFTTSETAVNDQPGPAETAVFEALPAATAQHTPMPETAVSGQISEPDRAGNSSPYFLEWCEKRHDETGEYPPTCRAELERVGRLVQSAAPQPTVTYQAACATASAAGRRGNPQCSPAYVTMTPAGAGR
ncbi:MAG: hypothetical protein KC419_10045, partial [Anaerolineales bacterium]|nr:hypothetical protein [Anaerolineales bacterium]